MTKTNYLTNTLKVKNRRAVKRKIVSTIRLNNAIIIGVFLCNIFVLICLFTVTRESLILHLKAIQTQIMHRVQQRKVYKQTIMG